MDTPDNPAPLSPLGRFIVKFRDATQANLSADQVIELLDAQAASIQEIFRIHRMDGRGRMELVGVSLADCRRRDCLLFSRNEVRNARKDFDDVLELASRTPPPCRVEVQLGHVDRPDPSHVVVLIFPAPCTESVGQWLTDAGLRLGDLADGSSAVLAAYEDAGPQVVKRHTLAAAPG
jgi:hypothetical protein